MFRLKWNPWCALENRVGIIRIHLYKEGERMYRFNQIAAVLVGTFLAFGPAAQGQDCNCKQGQDCTCKKGCSCKENCGCKQDCSCNKEASGAGQPQACTCALEQKGDEAALANAAAVVVSEALSQDRLRDAKAVAVIPNVRGKGLMTIRDADGHWLPPAFIQITGGNLGLQAGYESMDLILIFTDEKAVVALLKRKLTLNADASVAGPSSGRQIAAGAPVFLTGGIYCYSRSTGIFAGASLDGAAIRVDDQSDAKIYGKGITGEQILLSRSVESNTAVAPFLEAMERPGSKTKQVQTEN
jgi:lipid-binding SYLF domain-containing protein